MARRLMAAGETTSGCFVSAIAVYVPGGGGGVYDVHRATVGSCENVASTCCGVHAWRGVFESYDRRCTGDVSIGSWKYNVHM